MSSEQLRIMCYQCGIAKTNVTEYPKQTIRGVPIFTDRICADCYPIISEWVYSVHVVFAGNSPPSEQEFCRLPVIKNAWDIPNKRLKTL